MFVAPYRRSLSAFERLASKTVGFSFSDTGLGTVSDMGQQRISWQAISGVSRGPRVWLVKFTEGSYMTLPIANLDEEAKVFIIEQIRKSGGRTR